MMRRRGGLVRTVGRTAVVAGTASAVAGGVSRRQSRKYEDQRQEDAAQQQSAYEQGLADAQTSAPPPAAAPADDTDDTDDDADAVVGYGPLAMDLRRHRCTWNGDEVVLTVTEFSLLHTLLRRVGRVYSRDELVDRAYGHGHVITDRTVDSHIRRIRKKMKACAPEADPVETVYGVGYRLRENLRES